MDSPLNETNVDALNSDPDYILSKRFGFSLKNLLAKFPEGAPAKVIADALGITEDEVERRYQNIVVALKKSVQKGKFRRTQQGTV